MTKSGSASRAFVYAMLVWLSPAVLGQALPDGLGKDLVEVVCTECHDTARISAQRKTKAEWEAKVTEMLQEDPDVTQAERDTIVAYLAAQFPKTAAKINVNKAGAKDLEAALDLSAGLAQAIVDYRARNGVFRNLEDLKKVPGLDAAHIDARKDRLEF